MKMFEELKKFNKKVLQEKLSEMEILALTMKIKEVMDEYNDIVYVER